MNNNPIGIFDSGIGGLTVLRKIIEILPNEKYIYYADKDNVPYGTKLKEEVKEYIKDAIKFLISKGVKAIVIACNTASVASMNLDCKVPVFRIIEPTANNALKVSNNIGVLATNFTIESKGYDLYLKDNMKGIKASPFVTIVEEDSIKTEQSQKVIYDILNPFKGEIDSIILGCTHFSVLEEDVKKVLGQDIKIIDSCKAFTGVLKKYLDNNNLNNENNDNRRVIINFTKEGNVNTKWFKYPFEGINFIDIK